MDCCGVGGCFVCSECSDREGRQKGGWRICALDHQHSLSLVGLHLFCIQPILLVVAASDPLKADVDTTLISTKQISLTLSEVTSLHAKSGLLASVPSGACLWLLSFLFTEFQPPWSLFSTGTNIILFQCLRCPLSTSASSPPA